MALVPYDVRKVINETVLEEGKWEKPRRGVFRASGLYQPRRLVFTHDQDRFPGEPISARGKMTFERGTQAHERLRALLRQGLAAAGHDVSRIPVRDDEEEAAEKVLPSTNGWMIRGHPDGVLPPGLMLPNGSITDRDALLEIKTVNNYGWDKFLEGDDSDNYIAQRNMYMDMLGLDTCVILAEKKDTQHLALRADRLDRSVVNVSVKQCVQAADAIDAGTSPLELDPCEGPDYGWQDGRSGSRSLGWKCSYCPFWRHCFPEAVKIFERGRVSVIDASRVRAGTMVVSMGTGVVPGPGWNLLKEE